MELKIILNTEKAEEEIIDLNDYIREQNMKGVITKVEEKKAEEGTMGIGDYMPVISLILASPVIAAGIKGIFEACKNYFDLRKQQAISNTETEKTKAEEHKMEFVIETAEGKKINLKISSFDEEERKRFLDSVDTVIKG